MNLELRPEQPPAVVGAVAALLAIEPDQRGPGPWWQAGLDENLQACRAGPAGADRQGATTARPRSTRGADRA